MGGGGGGGSLVRGGQGGCERRIKVFVKIQKKKFFLGGEGGVRVDVRIKIFVKIPKKKSFFFGGVVELGGIRVDVNEELN